MRSRPSYREPKDIESADFINLLNENFKRIEVDITHLQNANLEASNSAPGTVLGTVIGKVEIFDKDRNSLGFLPIYDQIT